jgi:hypothetical protein
MRYEGSSYLGTVPVVYADVHDDGAVVLRAGSVLASSLVAVVLPENASGRLILDPELLAAGLDLANAGHRYGDRIYLRVTNGVVMRQTFLGHLVADQPASRRAK